MFPGIFISENLFLEMLMNIYIKNVHHRNIYNSE